MQGLASAKMLFWAQLDPAYSTTRPDAISNGTGRQRVAQDKNFTAYLGKGCDICYLDICPCSFLMTSLVFVKSLQSLQIL